MINSFDSLKTIHQKYSTDNCWKILSKQKERKKEINCSFNYSHRFLSLARRIERCRRGRGSGGSGRWFDPSIRRLAAGDRRRAGQVSAGFEQLREFRGTRQMWLCARWAGVTGAVGPVEAGVDPVARQAWGYPWALALCAPLGPEVAHMCTYRGRLDPVEPRLEPEIILAPRRDPAFRTSQWWAPIFFSPFFFFLLIYSIELISSSPFSFHPLILDVLTSNPRLAQCWRSIFLDIPFPSLLCFPFKRFSLLIKRIPSPVLKQFQLSSSPFNFGAWR